VDRYRLGSIGKASQMLGVSITTLKHWKLEGKFIPERTAARQRRYDLTKLKPEWFYAGDDNNGSRSHKNQKLIESVKKVVTAVTADDNCP
jgi:predicted site-specific integrase-resolvase